MKVNIYMYETINLLMTYQFHNRMKSKTASLFCLLSFVLLVQVTSCHQEEKSREVLQSTVLAPIYYEYNYERIEQELLENICLQFRGLHQRLTKEAISATQAKNKRLLEVKTNQKKISELTYEIIEMYEQLSSDVSSYAKRLRIDKMEIVKHQVQNSKKKCKEKGILMCEEKLADLLEHSKKEVQIKVDEYQKSAEGLINQEQQMQALGLKYSLNIIPITEPFEKEQEMSQEQYQQWKQHYQRNGRFHYDYSDYYNYVNDQYLQYGWRKLTRRLVVILLSKGKECSGVYKSQGHSLRK